MTGTTLAAALKQARLRLTAGGIADPALDSRLIVEHLTGTTRAHAITAPQRPLSPDEAVQIEAALKRRLSREPVHRILGRREFYGLDLALTPGTLEPRPDTETLVDATLSFVRARVARMGECRILDLGTGTGAIALALLSQVEAAIAVGSDISEDALATAAGNAARNGLAHRFSTICSNWFTEISGEFALIVSNPPYIRTIDLSVLEPEIRLFDPIGALDGGQDGLDAYRLIAAGAAAHLEPGGQVALEVGQGQSRAVEDIFAQAAFGKIGTAKDFGGVERVLVFAAV